VSPQPDPATAQEARLRAQLGDALCRIQRAHLAVAGRRWVSVARLLAALDGPVATPVPADPPAPGLSLSAAYEETPWWAHREGVPVGEVVLRLNAAEVCRWPSAPPGPGDDLAVFIGEKLGRILAADG